jgi:hypothetical protein
VDANIDFVSSRPAGSGALKHSQTTDADTSATEAHDTDTPATETPKTPGSTNSLGADFGALFADSGKLDSGPTGVEDEAAPSETASVVQLGGVPLDLTHFNTDTWPSWLSSAVDYLKGISTSPEWVALITKLVVFEEVLGFSNTVSLVQSYNVFRFLTEYISMGGLNASTGQMLCIRG